METINVEKKFLMVLKLPSLFDETTLLKNASSNNNQYKYTHHFAYYVHDILLFLKSLKTMLSQL